MIRQLDNDTEPLVLLRYFNIFRHPLHLEDILRFSSAEETAEDLERYLDELVSAGTINKKDNYYFFEGHEQDIEKREKGEELAAKLIPRAKKVARFLAKFPFVKFVGISGSLSKGYADEKTDYDFFIVTAENTLWICRTLLHVLKKFTFLAGKEHSFCMNYFIDESHLELEEQNIFTRIELSTLIPVYNYGIYQRILLSNQRNLPNLVHLDVDLGMADQYKGHNSVKEKNSFWKPLNALLMKLTDLKWKRKWQKKGYPMADYPLAFKTTPHISKNHPKNYQKAILNKLQKQAS